MMTVTNLFICTQIREGGGAGGGVLSMGEILARMRDTAQAELQSKLKLHVLFCSSFVGCVQCSVFVMNDAAQFEGTEQLIGRWDIGLTCLTCRVIVS